MTPDQATQMLKLLDGIGIVLSVGFMLSFLFLFAIYRNVRRR